MCWVCTLLSFYRSIISHTIIAQMRQENTFNKALRDDKGIVLELTGVDNDDATLGGYSFDILL